MPVIELRAECSPVLDAVIDAMRGDIERQDFLMHALAVGLGHMQEEVLTQHRNETYQKLTGRTDQFAAAIALHKLIPAKEPVAPTPFGRDVTRPRAVSNA